MKGFHADQHRNKSKKHLWPLWLVVAAIACILIVAFISRTELKKDPDWLGVPADSLAIRGMFASSRPLSPEESLEKMVIEEAFDIELVAAEPLVISPVAMTFDYSGRMWVVEMTGYMPDTVGTGEDKPSGKVVILEDRDRDGLVDVRKVFLDSLVLPRAIALVDNGVLVAEPPNLWFVEINNDKPGRKYLVDGEYTQGGNAEHQSNGLIRGLDNWIYNANSRKRYRKVGDQWHIERTHFRGQWGISHDNAGRMFYNHNSANLLGDYFPPSVGAWNENQLEVSGFNETIIADKQVYPARPNMGVNRAYRPGTLDPWLRLRSVTAACSPLVYRGALFGEAFDHNVFVAEPAGNLVKRNILIVNGNEVTGRQAYEGKEFLASTDERFRPVSLYNGPDGALYIVDMYRGIIEHKTYLTDYLQKEIEMRGLSHPLDYGRIYKVVPDGKSAAPVTLRRDPDALLKHLAHDNGWIRDKAQQLIVETQMQELVPRLRGIIKAKDHPVAIIHAMWTLQGLNALEPEDVIPLLNHSEWSVEINAFAALQTSISKNNYPQYVSLIESLSKTTDSISAPLVAYAVKAIAPFNKKLAEDILFQISKRFPYNQLVVDAVISSLEGQEASFLRKADVDTSHLISKRLNAVLADIGNSVLKKKAKLLEKKYPEGYALFKSTCQTCHGADGNGIKSVAPPLNQSEWVTGDKKKLASIVLFGLTGPVKVSGKLYASPEIAGDMPGLAMNTEVTDQALAELLTFIRISWRNQADAVTAKDVAAIRKKHYGRQHLFTVEELN